MKLLFDLYSTQPVGTTKYHGGGEYGKRLFSSIVETYESEIEIDACYAVNNYLDDWLLAIMQEHGVGTVEVSSASDIIKVINTSAYDRFYSPMPYYLRDGDLHTKTRVLGTIHGLRSIEMPTDRTELVLAKCASARLKALAKRYAPREMLRDHSIEMYRECLRALDYVFTDSEHSRAAIKNWLDFSKDVEVRYPFPKYIQPSESDESELGELPNGAPFVLMVSCDRWLKNPLRGIEAIDSLFSRGLLDGYYAVCVGLQGSPLLRKISSKDRFVALPYVSAGALERLYERCSIFFYPTLNEGFGYPPIEAMRHGTTCVVSCTCSVPEICGTAALYFNPLDVGEMQTRLVQAADHPLDSCEVTARYREIEKRQLDDLKAITSSVVER